MRPARTILIMQLSNSRAMLLPLGYWGTLLLGPVIVVRYAFPLIVLVPLLAGICFQKDDML